MHLYQNTQSTHTQYCVACTCIGIQCKLSQTHAVSYEFWNGGTAGWQPAYRCGNPASDGNAFTYLLFHFSSQSSSLPQTCSLSLPYTHAQYTALGFEKHSHPNHQQQSWRNKKDLCISLSFGNRIWWKRAKMQNNKQEVGQMLAQFEA